jgi:hypothetical protein
MDRREQRAAQRDEVNCGPLSEVIHDGTPNRQTQPANSALAQSAADVLARGIASGQREQRSTMVNRYVKPPEEGRGLTRSTLMCEKRWAGTGNAAGGGTA